ncbi:GGDEF domain-containing protein [Caproicibacter sp.]|uniref:GGDEF domain-containing protein n=1 Tax=Caproicibacter sp. TaxID=2814884 RepID=UPI003988BBDB
MNILAYSELNSFAFAFLFVIFLNIRNKGQKYFYDQRIFLTILALNAVLLVLDTLQWILIGKPGAVLRILSLLTATVYCAMTPFPCFFWSLYADYQIYKDEDRIKKRFVPMAIPLILNLLLTLLSVFYGFLFVIDQNNIYHRGGLFYVMAGVCYFYFVYSVISIVRNRESLEKKVYISLLLFALPPFLGGIIQALFYGVSIVWDCTAISIMIIFLNIQNSQMYTDPLTGLYNRRQLENYMRGWIKDGREGAALGVIMTDLDSFKRINDSWGHDAGDQALVEAGKILRDSFRREDLICRFGGDEFVIVLKIKEGGDLTDAVKRLKMNTKTFNERTEFPYSINFSVGFDVYNRESGMSVQQFMKQIDLLMYEDKSRKKSAEKTGAGLHNI